MAMHGWSTLSVGSCPSGAIYGQDRGSCEDGAQAIKVLRRDRLDLVVTDHMMPGIDGLRLAEFININLPTFGYCSPDTFPETSTVGLPQGISRVIAKPAFEAVLTTVQQLRPCLITALHTILSA